MIRRTVTFMLIVICLVATALPAAADGVTETSDTLSIVKEEEDLSNSDIAVRLSEETPLVTDRVLIGRDDEFVDSMTAGMLQSDSPLLLVPPDGPVPDNVASRLAEIAPERVTLLGGEQALSPGVEAELAALGLRTERRAGPSRFETAIAVAQDEPDATTAILARAFASEGSSDPTQAFADSLAAGGLAAEQRWPILLTQTDLLTAPTRDYIASADFDNVLIMGGTAAISAAVEAEVAAMGVTVERIAGEDRFSTGIAVAERQGASSAADVARITLVDAQDEDAWAGGFAAASHSAFYDAPIVLTAGDVVPPATAEWLRGGSWAGTAEPFGGVRLTCVSDPEACAQSRRELQLPPTFPVTFSPRTGSLILPGAAITVDTGGIRAVVVGGECVSGTPFDLPDDGIVQLDPAPEGTRCRVLLGLDLPRGVVQRETASYLVQVPQFPVLGSVDGAGAAVGGDLPVFADDGNAFVYVSAGDPTGQAGDGTNHVWWTGMSAQQTTTQLIDVRPDGAPAASGTVAEIARAPQITADGSLVVFHSADNALDSGGALGQDTGVTAYVRDVAAGATVLLSLDAEGDPVRNPDLADLSDDGRVAVYRGGGTGPTGALSDQIFIRNMQTGAIDVVRDHDGDPYLNADASALDLSADGSTIVFTTTRNDLVAEDTNAREDVFAYDIASRSIEIVSVNEQGEQGVGGTVSTSQRVAVSGDGTRVAFESRATNLAGNHGSGPDVFLRDRAENRTVLASVGDGQGTALDAATFPDINDAGNLVVYTSAVVPQALPQGGCGVFRFALDDTTSRVDVTGGGQMNTGTCVTTHPRVAGNGLVIFDTFDQLAAADTNGESDIYIGL